jgi:hypothetical protein
MTNLSGCRASVVGCECAWSFLSMAPSDNVNKKSVLPPRSSATAAASPEAKKWGNRDNTAFSNLGQRPAAPDTLPVVELLCRGDGCGMSASKNATR